MKVGAQPEVRVIVYAEPSLLERLESSSERDDWLEAVQEACGCQVESVGPVPGEAWVLRLPGRPDSERLALFLQCLRERPHVEDAESDQLLQPSVDEG